MTTTTESPIRELDHRHHDGMDVSLLWNARTNEVAVAVHDERADETFELRVAPADALDAFNHPYAYLGASLRERAFAA
jgi:hypothetical protein